MNDTVIYFVIGIVILIAYKKYSQNKILKLVPNLLEQGAQIIDVRTQGEFELGHKDGSINIPVVSLVSKLDKIDKSKPIILCCASGTRSGIAKTILLARGFKNVHNVGTWNSLLKFY